MPMTSLERWRRMFEHREADRVPFFDSPWKTTIERWQREGMPQDVSWVDYFDLDHGGSFRPDNSPRYPAETVEETDEVIIYTTRWGAKVRDFKHRTTVPDFIDYTITDADTWAAAKKRIAPTRDRIDWDALDANYKATRAAGGFFLAGLWFGFDVSHARMVGTERLLMALATDPDWVVDMWTHQLEVNLALLEVAWNAGYEFDGVFWPDDMGYKGHQFFSLDMYRALLKPLHQRAIDWAHARGIPAELHSCGDVRPFVPELVDMGLDGLNPLEVKAGMDPLVLKRDYGDRLVLHGGINAVNWNHPEAIEAEIRQKVPRLKENGGYIFASDHSIPDSVSLADFTRIVALVKECGSYDA